MPIIETVTAYVVEETPGDEGIPGVMTSSGWIPLISSDAANLLAKREMAQHIANTIGKELKVVRFSVREVIDVVKPESDESSRT